MTNKLSNEQLLEKAKKLREGDDKIILLSNGTFERECPICHKKYILTRQNVLAALRKGYLGCCSRACAAKNRPTALETNKKILEEGKKLNSSLTQIDGDIFELKCPVCHKTFRATKNLLYKGIKTKMPGLRYCSLNCSSFANRIKSQEKRDENAIKKYGSLEARNKYVAKKQEEGVIKKYGSRAEMGKESRKKAQETYFKRTGYTHNMRNPECVKINQQHRVETIKNFTPEQKQHWYEARIKTQKENGTLLFGGKRGGNGNNHSKKADAFFEGLMQQDFFKNKKCYFGNNEKKIGNSEQYYFVDFFDEDDSIIIEFYGDFWHANPKMYAPDDLVNLPENKTEAKNIWEYDKKRIDFLKNLGYNKIVIVWEYDYDNKIITPEQLAEELK